MASSKSNSISDSIDSNAPTLQSVRSWTGLLSIGWLQNLVLAILILSSLAGMTYRLLHTQRLAGKQNTPMLSANDRSRWVSIRALMERGDYEIEAYTADPERSAQWNTIDKVIHLGKEGRTHQYSSKPPLLATLLSAPASLISRTFGWNWDEHLFGMVRATLWLCQILPLALTWGYLAWLLKRLQLSPGTQVFVVAVACWGTYVTTFAVSLNNHHFAVLGVYWTLFAYMEIQFFQRPGFLWFLVLGLAASFTATNELPALSFLLPALAWAAWQSPRRFLTATLPAAMIVAFAFFATNLIAHQSLRPPYAHRSDGAAVLNLPAAIQSDLHDYAPLPESLRRSLNAHADQWGFEITPTATIEKSRFPTKPDIEERYVIRDYFLMPWSQANWRGLALTRSAGQDSWQVRQWDNWYDYPGSYWHDGARKGVDIGESNPAVYAFHCLVGHHGIFSLTPVWLLVIPGWILALRRERPWQWLAITAFGLSIVVIGFYLMRPPLDRNYGGQCSALRWVFWLSPLWILTMIPAIETLGKWRWGQWTLGGLLILSVISALVPAFNPWVHPWIYQWWLQQAL